MRSRSSIRAIAARSDYRSLGAAVFLGCATMGAMPAVAGSYTIIAPYAGAGTSTGVNGINDAGYITGVVGNADGSSSGFLRDPGGSYTLFTVPGGNGFDTYGRSIDNSNVITGYSTDNTGALMSDTQFRRDPNGALTILTNPVSGDPLHGVAGGRNASGQSVGDYFFTSSGLSYRHGYVLDGASFTDISVEAPNTDKTVARAITDSGTIVGWEANRVTGFTRGYIDIGGVFTFVIDPNASNAGTTYLEDVNNHGLASGEWADAAGILHPFLYTIATGKFQELAPPTADSYFVFGINNLGQAVLAGQNTGQNYLYTPSTTVPEPTALALMVGGLGALRVAMRRRGTRVVRGQALQ